MYWDGREYCDQCRLLLDECDKLTIKISENGKTTFAHLHNRGQGDCLDLKLDELAQKFESTNSAPSH